jgi:hypothetical protein
LLPPKPFQVRWFMRQSFFSPCGLSPESGVQFPNSGKLGSFNDKH